MNDGQAPWVTGWGMIDTLHTAGRDDDDLLVWALLDAEESSSVSVEPLDLVAAQASRTVTLRFTRHFVPHERVTATVPRAVHLEGDPESVRFTGSLALGVAGRAISLLGDDAGGLVGSCGRPRSCLSSGPARESAPPCSTASLVRRLCADPSWFGVRRWRKRYEAQAG